MAKLERLIKVPLRKFWEGEASDFTPWLADEKNISWLGETIGLELEVEAVEKNVGPFRADIVCKDIATGNRVLIENQFERTDHRHLGQLLTYAAELKAVTMVWIAERFTDEHRTALDWLNEITDEGFSFFGLKIELWRIGDSSMAPKFNVVLHPNNWTKTVSRISGNKLTSTPQLYFDYWTAFGKYLEQRNGVIKPMTAQPAQWIRSAGLGRTGCELHPKLNKTDGWIRVVVFTTGENGKAYFRLLKQDRVAIKKEIGAELEWEENREDSVERYISLYQRGVDLEDRSDWNRQHQWLCEQLETFHKVFSPRVKTLDANDYLPEEDETDE